MFRILIHLSSGACDLFVELFHGLYCSGSMRVGVTLWFGLGGVVSGCRLFVELFHGLYCSGSMRVGVTLWYRWGGVVSGYHTTPAKPQRNTNTHRTRAIQPMK